MFRIFYIIVIIASISFLGCQQTSSPSPIEDSPQPFTIDSIQASSFDQKITFKAIKDIPAVQKHKDSLLNIAHQNYLEDSTNLNNIIWYGRRLAYLTYYKEAIDVYTKGLEHHPHSPELYRHRGHRYISIRQPQKAVNDLLEAATLLGGREIEAEPDGIPNKDSAPISTLQYNVWYHLGIANYLQQNYLEAQVAFERCMDYSTNPDLLCATADWLYMTYRRSGKKLKALDLLSNIQEGMELKENQAYYLRLLMYKGILLPNEILLSEGSGASGQLNLATQGYGVANWYLYNGNPKRALDIFDKILETSYWPAFGFIAAESDLKYLKNRYKTAE